MEISRPRKRKPGYMLKWCALVTGPTMRTASQPAKRLIVYSVKQISYAETKPFILGIHYAGRMPSISYAFGLFEESKLVGVVSFGSPASAPLCRGICGDSEKSKVIELNRLVLLNNKKNEASFWSQGQ